MIENLPAAWDFEADLVAIGSGIGGLSAAITAHDHGASALVVERSDQVGGVTALSMGELWVAGNRHAAAIGIEDSPESGYRYLKRLSMDYGSDLAILNMVVHARLALGYFEEAIGLSLQTGLLYSVYEDTKTGRQHVVYRANLGEGAPKSGRFFPVQAPPLADITDSAMRDLVKRYATESTLGNFGVYVGNQEKGRVHAVAVKG